MSESVADYPGFLKGRCHESIIQFAREYPDKKIFVVPYWNYSRFDNEAGVELLNHPDRELKALQDALRDYPVTCDDTEGLTDNRMPEAKIAIKGLLESEKIPIHKIGHDLTNKLISIEGRITKIAPTYQKEIEGAFRCVRCGDMTRLPQPDERYQEPFECSNDSCGRRGPFKHIQEESDYEDRQKIGLQDLNEAMKPGQPLREIIVVLRDAELIQAVSGMGAQCTITGILRLQQKPLTSIYHAYLEALHIEPKSPELDLSVSEAEKQEFRALAARSDIMQMLINSTAPEILGYTHIKAGLLCAVVSGGDKTRFRDYIHMIVCGDPGMGKTALLKFIRTLIQRAQYSAGRGSSVAGLTVAVVKDELSGGGYTAQAGAFVLADRGLMILDDCDKLEPEDFQAMNTALEEGFIEIHKGGINQTFNTRFPMIALCNPKNIRFDPYEPLSKQISVPADTVSRFDLIFKIQDIPNVGNDKLIAEHQARQWALYEGGDLEQTEGGSSLSHEKLGKYLQFAKTIVPRTTPEVRQAITEYYLTLRKIDETGTIAATARQNNGIYRLTKSIAKLRLSETCCIEDVEKAIQIHQASLEALRDPKTGKIDIDIAFGASKSQRESVKVILAAVRSLQGTNGNSVPLDLLIQTLEQEGLRREFIEDAIPRLKTAGDLLEVSNNRFRAV